MIYQEFAQFYDDLFDPEMYDKWAAYTTKRVNSDESILDLACGTGRLAVILQSNGYQVTGGDLSDDMLALASEHLINAGLTPNLVQVDMRDLSELPVFDVVTCFDDSLCYLIDQTDLLKAFQQINQHVKPGGKFLFDVITPYQTDEVYPGYMYNYQDDDRAFMWTSYQGEFAPHSVEHELSFFQFDEQQNNYERYEELHQERTYAVKDYQQMLQAAGFNSVTVTTDFGKHGYKEKVKRWFFECIKEG
ncbi:class I SAM-dependent methyltransferase [Lentilactobacillus senioris]|uniref:class I SAM-dependent DNA methyltransferase n=1 Tax=Lentilactobacillus senioris TaxID=931534 RepID=UPI00227F746B|nr:class I SAM-dependent methyltransferase [Lentilactobacillus senioris]MCY9806949.1 class I SAM-dependent methyltransferase [Lentilactobacillus senioris]